MGDLSVVVRLNGEVVEDRVIPVERIVRIGESPDAAISFPGADIAVVRMADRLAVRGRTLEEGEEMQLELGPVEVRVEHTVRANLPPEWAGLWDKRFLAAALLVTAAGTWIDAAEAWLDRQPPDAIAAVSQVRGLFGVVGVEGAGQRATTMPAAPEAVAEPDAPPVIADGPRHIADDHLTRTGWAAWYRRLVPDDADQTWEALDRLAADPGDASARRVLARAAYDREDFELAAWHWSWLVDRFPADLDARLRLAWAEKRRGLHRHEIELCEGILLDDATHLEARAGLAVALARLNRLDEATHQIDVLESLAPLAPATELATARIAALQGQDVRALEALDRAFGARSSLPADLQLELRRDIALDPAFASLRKDPRLRSLIHRHLGAAGVRPAR